MLACVTYSSTAGSWSACSKSCGGGTRVRSVACTSSAGFAVDASKCSVNALEQFETCNSGACPAFYYTFSVWSGCSATCGGGTQTRSVTCVDSAGVAIDAVKCAGQTPEASSAACNSSPCSVAVWSAAPWGPCSTSCGGVRERSALSTCNYADGRPVPVALVSSACPEASPAPLESCAPCSFCSDAAQNKGCSGHGSCANGACACAATYGGPTCSVNTATCASGVRDASQACCASGVIDVSGSCCAKKGNKTPTLSASGTCCASGMLDACGVCDGKAKVVDAQNVCCEVSSRVGVSRFDWRGICLLYTSPSPRDS